METVPDRRTGGKARWRHVALFGIPIVLALWLLLALPERGASPPAPPLASAPVVKIEAEKGAPHENDSPSRSSAREASVPAPPPPRFELLIVDELDGHPLKGASIYKWVAGSRFAAPSAPLFVANDEGLVSFEHEEERVLVACDGHVSREARVVAGTRRLALPRSHEAMVLCEDQLGGRVAGAKVVLSQWGGVRLDEVVAGSVAGGNSRDACYAGVSDADGVVTLRGLAPGSYGLHVSHDRLAWVVPRVGRTPAPTMTVPGPVHTLVMREPFAFAISVRGDRVVYHNGKYSSPLLLGGNYENALAPIRRFLRSKYGDSVLTDVALFADSAGVPGEAILDCCLENRGWSPIRAVMRPLSAVIVEGPQIVDLPSGTGASRRVTVRLRQADGSPLAMAGKLRLKAKELREGAPVMPEVSLLKEMALPFGDYAIDDATHPVLAALLPGHWISVKAGSSPDIEASLPVPLAWCSIRVVSEIGAVGVKQVEIEAAGLPKVRRWIREECSEFLPVGSVTMRVDAGAPFAAYEGQHQVGQGVDNRLTLMLATDGK